MLLGGPHDLGDVAGGRGRGEHGDLLLGGGAAVAFEVAVRQVWAARPFTPPEALKVMAPPRHAGALEIEGEHVPARRDDPVPRLPVSVAGHAEGVGELGQLRDLLAGERYIAGVEEPRGGAGDPCLET